MTEETALRYKSLNVTPPYHEKVSALADALSARKHRRVAIGEAAELLFDIAFRHPDELEPTPTPTPEA